MMMVGGASYNELVFASTFLAVHDDFWLFFPHNRQVPRITLLLSHGSLCY